MSDGIVFLARVFLSALWFGRPHLISIITVSSFSRRRRGELFISAGARRIPTHIGDNPSHLPRRPICRLAVKAQTFLTCQLWCQPLHFSCIWGGAQASDKAHVDTFMRSANIADMQQTLNIGTRHAFDDGSHNIAVCSRGRHQACLLQDLLNTKWSSILASQRNSGSSKQMQGTTTERRSRWREMNPHQNRRGAFGMVVKKN